MLSQLRWLALERERPPSLRSQRSCPSSRQVEIASGERGRLVGVCDRGWRSENGMPIGRQIAAALIGSHGRRRGLGGWSSDQHVEEEAAGDEDAGLRHG